MSMVRDGTGVGHGTRHCVGQGDQYGAGLVPPSPDPPFRLADLSDLKVP